MEDQTLAMYEKTSEDTLELLGHIGDGVKAMRIIGSWAVKGNDMPFDDAEFLNALDYVMIKVLGDIDKAMSQIELQ